METRVVETTESQVKIHFAKFNNMRGHTEQSAARIVTVDKQKLLDRIKELEVPDYKDEGQSEFENNHTFHKCYKKGSVLEWYNKIDVTKPPDYYGQGVSEDWVPAAEFENIKIDPSWEFIA
jgi:hypothetical protein